MISFSPAGAAGYGRTALMAICLCLAVLVSGKTAANKTDGLSDRKETAQGGSRSEKYAYFNNFLIYQTDTRAKNRILVCDVAVELHEGVRLLKSRPELRRMIYHLLKCQSDVLMLRELTKDKIKMGLNHFMAAEIIKTVYFTKLILM